MDHYSKHGLNPEEETIEDILKPLAYTMINLESMELYHIPSDPSEKVNLIQENTEVLEKMLDLAKIAREDMGDALIEKQA